jgi:hypothetical protein
VNIRKLAQRAHVSLGTKKLKLKRHTLANGGWFLHWDNSPVHTTASIRLWLEKHNVQVIPHLFYSLDLAPAGLFLFPKVKELMASQSLTLEMVKLTWDWALSCNAIGDFAGAFW